MDGFHKELPPPQGIGELNGRMLKDVDGRAFTLTHLSGVARRLGVKTRAECLALLTYLKDRDPKVRFIAARAIEDVVHAYPGGMSLHDILEIDSDGHRELIRRFVDKIDKLPTAATASIDRLVARLSSSDGLWKNGLFPRLDVPATASTEHLVTAAFQKTSVDGRRVATFRIVEHRQVRIPGTPPDGYTAVLAETDLGTRIVLLQHLSKQLGWWSRVYDAEQGK
jgi:hypothetical protein